MKLVIDTNVLVAGLRSKAGASNALLVAGFRRRFRWGCSVPLFYEYEDVLNRAEFLLATGISHQEARKFLMAVSRIIVPIELNFRWRPQLTDPADEMVLEAAINARAQAIVTHNMRDFGATPLRFGIEVLTPAEVLRRIVI
jgi:putative PIN family toxin of toxin-antitoxin system